MKTRKYIFATLIALIFGIIALQAQPARRNSTPEKKEKPAATRTYTKKSTPSSARMAEPARQAQQPQAERQKSPQPVRQAQQPQAERQKSPQPVRQAQQPQVERQKSPQPVRQAQQPQVERQKSPQPVRQAQQPQVERQRTTHPVSQAQQPQAERQRTTQPVSQAQQPQVERQRTTQQVQRPVSIATSDNPRSTYRKANTTVYVTPTRSASSRVNKYSTERYYGGNHYHYAYPTTRVNIHYHHDTYLHNYHVLYYPTYTNIYWSRNMYRDYCRWYPEYRWAYNYGYRIQTISVFEAKFNMGEVAMVYGRVYATWYNQETDDYLLFFGGDFPNQQFTVVLPGNIARRFNWRPDRYFLGEHLTVTGLITTFDGIPEIAVKNKQQIGLY